MREIRNIVFDLGNVLLNFQPADYLESLFDDPDLVQYLHKVIFASPEWLMLDRGVISQTEAVERLVSQHPQAGAAIRKTFQDWFTILTPIESTVEILRDLAEKYRLYVISNFHQAAFRFVAERYDWFSLFTGLVVSYEHKVLKPEAEIYNILFAEYSLAPEECVFIDDSLANVEKARELGMLAIHYQTAAQFELELAVILNTNNKGE